MKEFAFQLYGWDIGIQFIDLGDKERYHIHVSIFDDEDGKEHVYCGEVDKFELDQLYKGLDKLRLSAIYLLKEEKGEEF